LDSKEKYRLSFLNVSAFLGAIYLFVFSFLNWSTLEGNGGWGILGVIAIVIITLFALIIDGIIQVKIRDKKKFNFLSGFLAILYLLILLSSFR
jgi:heme A synthase